MESGEVTIESWKFLQSSYDTLYSLFKGECP